MKAKLKGILPVFSSAYFLAKGLRDAWLNVVRLPQFKKEFKKFKTLSKSSSPRFIIDWTNRFPSLSDKTIETPFDRHYVFHTAWAARVLAKTAPELHIDISSSLYFCTIVSAFIPVKFFDYRPAALGLSDLTSERADLNDLPFENDSIQSISCMHTIEHIGLGRYGDPLDYDGDLKAISEIKRVTKPGGNILFVTPLGKPLLRFNSHRIYSFEQIIQYFDQCTLINFSLITDAGEFINDANPDIVIDQDYGCGCFWFKKN